jgi:hypothetical protein
MNCALPISAEIPPAAMLPRTKANRVGDGMYPLSEHSYAALTAQQYLADLAECDPEDACLFCAMGEVIARRTHGNA